MASIDKVTLDKDDWTPLEVGLEVFEGNPETQGLLVLETDADRGVLMAGFAELQPSSFEVTIDYEETIHVIEGTATVVVDGESELDLAPGVATFFPRGSVCRWTVHTPFREFFVASR
jgi:uncharacterized cupin superfamily protein